jgi:hypothetical protein
VSPMGDRTLKPSAGRGDRAVEEEQSTPARPGPSPSMSNSEIEALAASGRFGAARLALFGEGNAAVERALGGGRSPEDTGYQLRLDPEIEAEIRVIEAMRERLQLEQIGDALARVQLPEPPASATPPIIPSTTGPTTGPTATVPPAGPVESRQGSVGDIWRAVLADPAIGPAITELREQAMEQARRDWAELSTGAKIALVSTTAMIAAGATAGIASDPDAREWVMEQLSGTRIPVPMVPGLDVQIDFRDDVTMVGLRLDVGRLLPAELGFSSIQTSLARPATPP